MGARKRCVTWQQQRQKLHDVYGMQCFSHDENCEGGREEGKKLLLVIASFPFFLLDFPRFAKALFLLSLK